MSQNPEFTIVEREQMSILGLMVGEILANNLAEPRGAAIARKLSGRAGVTAGKMSITVAFDRGPVRLQRGLESGLKCAVRGTLADLLGVSLGQMPIGRFLRGELKIAGNPFFLLKLLPLIRVSDGGDRK